MLQRIHEFRNANAPGTAGLRVLRASCAGVLLLTESAKRVSIRCVGGEATVPGSGHVDCLPKKGTELAGTPLLQLRLRIDGAPAPAAAQAVLAGLLRSASIYDLLTCDALATTGVLR